MFVRTEVRERIVIEEPGFSMEALVQHEGPIAAQRLPIDPSAMPHPLFLQTLNNELDLATLLGV